MTTDTHGQRRLNPFAFPAETDLRFILLLATALALTWTIASFFTNTVLDEILGLPADEVEWIGELAASLQSAAIDWENLDRTAIELHQAQLRAVLLANLPLLVIPLTFILFLLILATFVYSRHPAYIRRHKRLRALPVSEDPDLFAELTRLSRLAGVSPPPGVEIAGGSRTTDGQAFGLPRRYVLRLGGRLPLLLRKAPDAFRAIILHELAHIANRDVGRTYFAQALWGVVFFLVLGSWIAYLYFTTIYFTIRELLQGGLAGVNWIHLFTVIVPRNLFFTFQVGLTLLLIRTIRSGMLRTREVYADWRAALWSAELPLLSILRSNAAKEKGGRWTRWWRLHPTAAERLELLQDPARLFHVAPDLSFLTGLLLGYVLSGLPRFVVLLWLPVRWGSEIAFLHVVQLAVEWPRLVGYLVVTAAQLFARHLIPDLALLTSLLIVAYLAAGTVGVQVQREAVADMVSSREGYAGYLHLLLPAALMTGGLEVGILLSPVNLLAPRGLVPILLAPLWLAAVTGLTWLWLVYARFFAQRLYGSWAGIEPPRWPRYLLTLALSSLLWVLYLPAVLGQLTITITQASLDVLGVDASTAGQILLLFLTVTAVTLIAALFLYGLAFGATLALLQLRRSFRGPRCPSCQQETERQPLVDQTCEHCGYLLAPWLFVEPIPTTR